VFALPGNLYDCLDLLEQTFNKNNTLIAWTGGIIFFTNIFLGFKSDEF
jgi:hypothetical protein